MKMQRFHTATGVSRVTKKSEAWARNSFKSGKLPTEAIVNGRFPAVSEDTLAALRPLLRPVGRPRLYPRGTPLPYRQTRERLDD